MSEYQYYEFQTIDRPLTAEQRAAIRKLSSRVELSATSAAFNYSFGSFRGDPLKVLEQYFDAMLYIANWGSKQLAFRLPSAPSPNSRPLPNTNSNYASSASAPRPNAPDWQNWRTSHSAKRRSG